MPEPENEPLANVTDILDRLLAHQKVVDQRLDQLEKIVLRNTALQSTVLPQPTAKLEQTPVARAPAPAALTAPVAPPPRATQPIPSAAKPVLETKVGLTILNRVGVLTLVLGVAFFFKWAADNDWIGPAGRVLLGVMGGFLTLLAGDFFWRKQQRTFAQGLTGAGIAILYVSIYAAFSFYQLIVQPFAFVLLFAVTAMAIALSLRYDAQAITILGLIAGYLTPLILSSGQDHPWFLFGYILLLDLAAIGLAKNKNWRVLEPISFGATVLIFGAWLLRWQSDTGARFPAILALLVYYFLYSRILGRSAIFVLQLLAALSVVPLWENSTAVFFLVGLMVAAGGVRSAVVRGLSRLESVSFICFWLSYLLWASDGGTHAALGPRFIGVTTAFLLFFLWEAWHLTRGRRLTVEGLSVLALNAGVYFGIAYSLLNRSHHVYLGPLAVAIAGLYLALGVWLYRRALADAVDTRPALLSLGVALCFLSLAIPIQFTGFTITLAWAFEAAAVTWIGARLNNRRAILGALVVSLLALMRAVMVDSGIYADARSHSLLWNSRFLAFLFVALGLLFSARWSKKIVKEAALTEFFGGHVALLFGLTFEVLDWVFRTTPPQNLASVQTLSVSVLFALYAITLIVAGVASRSALNRVAGLGLMALVIVKLYLLDVWELGRIYRISAFVALGVLLIATSFLYSKFRRLVEGLWKEDQTESH
jgi:uncharacterized membrane protein